MNFKKSKLVSFLLVSVVFILTLAGCSKKDEVVVGGKDYSESYIMSEMVQILIDEKTDLDTRLEDNLSGPVIFQAIKNDEVDLYVELVGSVLSNMHMSLDGEPEELEENVKEALDEELDISWLDSIGFNNTYAMVVTKETAEKYDLETVSDLAEVGDELILGADHTFTERDDGYPGLIERYDFDFKEVKGMEPSLMYQAVDQGDVDVISGYSTEGRIIAFDLVLLEDDKDFFPPYDAAPIIRNEVLEEHPELEDVLNSLAGRIDDEKMAELNAEVDLEERDPREVAREFLEEEGLIDK